MKQKQLRHDPIDKLLTGFVSRADGCGYTSDIDTAVKPYAALAQAWTLPAFAGHALRVVNDTLHLLASLELEKKTEYRGSDCLVEDSQIRWRRRPPLNSAA